MQVFKQAEQDFACHGGGPLVVVFRCQGCAGTHILGMLCRALASPGSGQWRLPPIPAFSHKAPCGENS